MSVKWDVWDVTRATVGRAVPLITLPRSLVFQPLCAELQPTRVGKLSFYKKKKTLFHSCVKTTAHVFPRIRSASRKSGFQLCSPILTATKGSVLEESWFLQWWKQLPWPPWSERCKQWGPFYRWAQSAAVLRRRRNRRQVCVKKGSDMRARLVGKCQLALSDPNMTSCTNIKPSCSSSGLNEQ